MRLHGVHAFGAFPLVDRCGGMLQALGPQAGRKIVHPETGKTSVVCEGFHQKNHYYEDDRALLGGPELNRVECKPRKEERKVVVRPKPKAILKGEKNPKRSSGNEKRKKNGSCRRRCG